MTKLIFLVCFGTAFFGANSQGAPPTQLEARQIKSDLLNPDQLLFYNWTEDRFGDLLHRDHTRKFSEETRKVLLEMSRKSLDNAINRKWENYRWHDESFEYTVLDYETWEAINVASALRDASAKSKIVEIATSRRAKDNRERWMAVRALAFIGDTEDVPKLISLLYHHNINTRVWAQIALVQITGLNKGADWKQWTTWWNDSHKDRKLPDQLVEWLYPKDATPEDLASSTTLTLLEKEAKEMITGIAVKALATGRLRLHPGFKPD